MNERIVQQSSDKADKRFSLQRDTYPWFRLEQADYLSEWSEKSAIRSFFPGVRAACQWTIVRQTNDNEREFLLSLLNVRECFLCWSDRDEIASESFRDLFPGIFIDTRYMYSLPIRWFVRRPWRAHFFHYSAKRGCRFYPIVRCPHDKHGTTFSIASKSLPTRRNFSSVY